MDKKLKICHKKLMIMEAGYIYCKRHNLNYDTFIDDVFMTQQFDSDGSEFDNICKDLRNFKYIDSYNLIEVTNDEYNMCVDKFVETKEIKSNKQKNTTVKLSLPSTKELRKARKDYNKRAIAGHFDGDGC